MAFLRLSRSRMSAIKGNRRKADLQAEADTWIAQRKAEMRSRSCQLLGRTFATKRKAAEFGKRLVDGQLIDGQRPAKAGKVQSGLQVKASMAVKPKVKAPGDCYRVRPVNGVWRRYVQADDGWRWVSDHAEMDSALAGREPLNEPE